MRGTVYKRTLPSGAVSWAYQIDAGKDATGKRLRPTKGGFRTKREADAARSRALVELETLSPSARTPRSFGDYLQEWLKRHGEQTCSPKTVERYRQLLGYVHIDLLNTPLQEVTTLLLEREIFRLKERGGHHRRTKEARPLSGKTVRHIAGLLSSALGDAVRLDLLRKNPAQACKLPPAPTKERAILDPKRLAHFLFMALGTKLYNLLLLDSATGLRRGELLALTVDDFDAIKRKLHVSKSLEQTKAGLRIKAPKNNKSRIVPLALLACEAIQRELKERESCCKMFGADFQSERRLVFAAPDGGFLKPDTLTSEVCRLAQKWGFPEIGLHSMRHTYGSQLLSLGVPLPVVSKILGHSNPRVTAEIYSHALPADEDAAVESWEALMRPILTFPEPDTTPRPGRMAADGSTKTTASLATN